MKFLLKFFRRNQRKFLALLAVASMITFVASLNPAPGGLKSFFLGDTALATLNGKPVTAVQFTSARRELGVLQALRFTDPNQQAVDVPFIPAVLGYPGEENNSNSAGYAAVNAIVRGNDRTFFLLLSEAHSQGFFVSRESDDVKSIVQNHIDPASVPADGADVVDDCVADLLSVRNWLHHALDVIKITKPYRNLEVATRSQKVTVRLVNFPANDYADKIASPTDNDLSSQYERFKNDLPENYTADDNPLGFGYTMPERRKVQFLGLKSDELHRAAVAAKTPLEWNIAAVARFKQNKARYDEQSVLVPSTRPATETSAVTQASPTTELSASQASATQPTTAPVMESVVRVLPDFDDDFKLHADGVLSDLYLDATNTLRVNILKMINESYSSEYGKWHDASAAATTLPAASEDFINADFFPNLAKSIQTKFGVLPEVGNIDQWKTASELDSIPNLGKSIFVNSTQQEAPFARYAPSLGLWQMSEIMQDEAETVYVFRISGIDLAHVQPMDQVKDRVTSDWKLAAEYDMAMTTAKSFLGEAQSKGFAAAALAGGFGNPVATAPFFPQGILVGSDNAAALTDLHLKPFSIAELAIAAQKLITTSPAVDGRSVGLAELRPDAKVFVIELASAESEFGADSSVMEAFLMNQDLQRQRTELAQAFCQYDAVAARMHFVPVAGAASEPSDK